MLSQIWAFWTLQDKDNGVQKKSYKVVAYLCESRPEFVKAHLQVRSCVFGLFLSGECADPCLLCPVEPGPGG